MRMMYLLKMRWRLRQYEKTYLNDIAKQLIAENKANEAIIKSYNAKNINDLRNAIFSYRVKELNL